MSDQPSLSDLTTAYEERRLDLIHFPSPAIYCIRAAVVALTEPQTDRILAICIETLCHPQQPLSSYGAY